MNRVNRLRKALQAAPAEAAEAAPAAPEAPPEPPPGTGPIADAVSAALNVTGDRLARLMEALAVVGKRVSQVRLVRVLSGEKPMEGVEKRGDFYYAIDLQPRQAPRGRDDRRGDRGPRRGDGRREAVGSRRREGGGPGGGPRGPGGPGGGPRGPGGPGAGFGAPRGPGGGPRGPGGPGGGGPRGPGGGPVVDPVVPDADAAPASASTARRSAIAARARRCPRVAPAGW